MIMIERRQANPQNCPVDLWLSGDALLYARSNTSPHKFALYVFAFRARASRLKVDAVVMC